MYEGWRNSFQANLESNKSTDEDFQISSWFGILADIPNNKDISKGANKPQNCIGDEEISVGDNKDEKGRLGATFSKKHASMPIKNINAPMQI